MSAVGFRGAGGTLVAGHGGEHSGLGGLAPRRRIC